MELLGPLQTALMQIMWKLESSRVGRIHELMKLSYDNRVMYTSVLTTLNTLSRKGMLKKEKVGRRENVFHVELSLAEYQEALLKSLCVDHFLGDTKKMQLFLKSMPVNDENRSWTLVPLCEQSSWQTMLKKSQEKSSQEKIGGMVDVLNRMIGSLTVSDEDYRILKQWSEECCGDAVPMICTTGHLQ